jgi:hypothetical protein
MAVLSNLISFHMGEYVNEHINRFEDDERAAIYFQCEGAYGNVTLRSIMDESPALVCYERAHLWPRFKLSCHVCLKRQ